ncbi:hypothetical protein TNCV_4571721 [Trichonephila clavipes]|nr:hypothetical protein TNCV_4571721 [Trichonephila clavipes]
MIEKQSLNNSSYIHKKNLRRFHTFYSVQTQLSESKIFQKDPYGRELATNSRHLGSITKISPFPLNRRYNSLVYADKPQTFDHLEDNICRVIADIRPQMLEKVIENWTSRMDYIRSSRGSPMPEIIFKRTAMAGSDVVQSRRPIFDEFFQHLWPYIGNNTANVVFKWSSVCGLSA